MIAWSAASLLAYKPSGSFRPVAVVVTSQTVVPAGAGMCPPIAFAIDAALERVCCASVISSPIWWSSLSCWDCFYRGSISGIKILPIAVRLVGSICLV